MIQFGCPWLLWFVPLAIVLGPLMRKLATLRRQMQLSSWGDRRHEQQFAGPEAPSTRHWLMAAACASAFVALSRPALTEGTAVFPVNSTQLVSILDDSRSMGARDSGPENSRETRLRTALKGTRDKLVPACEGNEMGIVTFAGYAFPQVLLSRSRRSILYFADRIHVSDAPGDGSDMQKAFELAFEYFKNADVKDKAEGKPPRKVRRIIVLWSDGGVDEKTDVNAIIAGCNQRNIQLLIFGIGGTTPTAVPVSELSERDRRSAPGELYGDGLQTALDESVLVRLRDGTAAGGSRYQRISTADEVSLPDLTDMDVEKRIARQELFIYPTLVFVACLYLASLAGRRATFPHS